jgi:hypothetical protein
MDQHPAIGVENLGFGHKAYIAALVVLYRQIPGIGIVENLHYLFHRVADV